MCPTGSALASLQTTKKSTNLLSAFEVIDADHDGKISQEDLRSFYYSSGNFHGDGGGRASDEEMIGNMMLVADANKDGFVEYDEFEKVVNCQNGRCSNNNNNNNNNNAMEEAFRVMDKDGDGKVGHQDLKSYLSWAGFQASDEDIEAMLRLGRGGESGGGNEGVTYEQFLKILDV